MTRRTASLLLMAVGVLLMTGAPLFADAIDFPRDKEGKTITPLPGAQTNTFAFYGKAVGAGLGAAFTIVGAGIGFGRIGGSAMESMARQPETAAQVQTGMIIIAALLEGVTFLALIICILIIIL
jgi:F-type H+-transporting ATPase subunit c